MNKLIFAVVALALLVGGFFGFNSYIYNEKQGGDEHDSTIVGDYLNTTYTISGKPVTFVNGASEVAAAPGSAEKVTTRYFGNNAKGDLNGDGIVDLAFLITQETGGSGTFFYLVGALQNEDGSYRGTNAVLIGDRIAPQTTEFKNGQVIVNYAERAPGEPMTARPSMGKSLYLKYSAATNDFGEVVQNFEGEIGANAPALDLSGQGLTKVSGDVFKRTELIHLDLSHNNLTGALQAEVRHLQELQFLDLSNNKFTGVPAEVGQLKNLEILNLSNNQLTGLPYELGNLSKLRVLDISGNAYSTADLEVIKKSLPASTQIKTQ